MAEPPTIRTARPDDDPRLLAIDLATWTDRTSPAPPPAEGTRTSFLDDVELDDVLVAEVDGAVAGWLRLDHPTPLASNRHVLQVAGLGVDPVVQRRGVGRALLDAVLDEARRLGLPRVFTEASITARPFFEARGFVVVSPQVVLCRGVEFVNYRMERALA